MNKELRHTIIIISLLWLVSGVVAIALKESGVMIIPVVETFAYAVSVGIRE